MPQLITISNPCPKCRAEFEAQRTEYCREFLRYQRENFAQRTEINALEVQLKHALEKLLRAERELIQAWKTSQQAEPVFARIAEMKKKQDTTQETPKCSQA